MYKRCHCGKFFETLTEKRIYCSDKCRPKKKYYIKKQDLKKVCKFCKVIFRTAYSSKVFCSDSCRLSYYDVGEVFNKECRECGRTFRTRKSFQFYCTNICYVKAKIKRDYKNTKRIRREE